MHPVLAEARALLEAGDLDRGELLLRGLLAEQPQDAQAWRELAGVLCRRGDLTAALPLLEHCLQLDPADIQSLTRMGAVLQNLGRLEAARAVLERAVAVNPSHGQAWCNLGIVCFSQAEPASLAVAREALERAQALEPDQPITLRALVATLRRLEQPAAALPPLLTLLTLQPGQWPELMQLGHELEQRGLVEEAETAYRQALAVASRSLSDGVRSVQAAADPEPSDPAPLAVLLAKLGVLLLEQKRLEEATVLLAQALEQAPRFAEAWANQALALRLLVRLEEALAASERALALDPACARFHGLQSAVLRELGRPLPALEALHRAMELDPQDPGHAADLALCLQDLGRFDEAMAAFSEALETDADNPLVISNRGICRLLISGQREGWDDYEARLRREEPSILLTPPTPRWQGEDLGGAPLLLVGEQGFGDMLHAIRYAPWLRQRVGSLALCLPVNLIPLAEASALADVIWTPQQAQAFRGAWLPLFSLFHVLSITPQQVQAPSPYLRVPGARLSQWRQRIDPAGQPLVALHWQGNPQIETGGLRGRSFPLELLAPLADCGPCGFLSMQKGLGAEQRLQCSFRSRFLEAQELVDTAWDYLDTAAILHCCDLLITGDSALAHLAGALGLPVWLLLQHQPDWRWGLEGDTSHWYPSMRLFRQQHPGDWAEVIERVCQALPGQLEAGPRSAD